VVVARVEGVAAAAGGDRVGVAHREPFAQLRPDVVDLRAAQVRAGGGVHEDAHLSLLDHRVVGMPLLVERHPVGEALASPGSDEHPQVEIRLLLIGQEFLQLGDGRLADDDHGSSHSMDC